MFIHVVKQGWCNDIMPAVYIIVIRILDKKTNETKKKVSKKDALFTYISS